MPEWMTWKAGDDPAPPQTIGALARRVLRAWRPPDQADPFEALRVQRSLARLEREIDRLRGDDDEIFAGAHHLRAAVLAYDGLLTEARRLAGLPAEPAVHSSAGRLLAVAELHASGWDW